MYSMPSLRIAQLSSYSRIATSNFEHSNSKYWIVTRENADLMTYEDHSLVDCISGSLFRFETSVRFYYFAQHMLFANCIWRLEFRSDRLVGFPFAHMTLLSHFHVGPKLVIRINLIGPIYKMIMEAYSVLCTVTVQLRGDRSSVWVMLSDVHEALSAGRILSFLCWLLSVRESA